MTPFLAQFFFENNLQDSSKINMTNSVPSQENLQRAANILGKCWPSKDRSLVHRALTNCLLSQGWPAEKVAEFAAAVADVQEPGNSNYDKRIALAIYTKDLIRRGEIVLDWDDLEQLVGSNVLIALACARAGMHSLAQDHCFASNISTDDIRESSEQVTARSQVTAPDPVNPTHYRGDTVMKIIEDFNLTFCLGNVVKYVLRHKEKAGLEDLKKARWYLDREMAQMEKLLNQETY